MYVLTSIQIVRKRRFDRPALSYNGERDCDDFTQKFASYAPYITHIISSPVKRCTETARKGLVASIRRGIRIQVMEALAIREGRAQFSTGIVHGDEDMGSAWIIKGASPREAKLKDSEFVAKYLTLKDMAPEEARGVREIVVVSQGQLLRALLGRGSLSLSLLV